MADIQEAIDNTMGAYGLALSMVRRSLGPSNLARAVALEALHRQTGNPRGLIVMSHICEELHDLNVSLGAKAFMENYQTAETDRKKLLHVRTQMLANGHHIAELEMQQLQQSLDHAGNAFLRMHGRLQAEGERLKAEAERAEKLAQRRGPTAPPAADPVGDALRGGAS